ncbi:MAG: phosphoribosylaminoimidazolesuccinocarboxamide synthase [Pyrinomonadaceae bacterium]
MDSKTVEATEIQGLECIHRGKVRDVYKIDESKLLLVATDRISAFDCVMPNQIPRKGEVLTQLAAFWFDKFSEITPNHLITTVTTLMPEAVCADRSLSGRSSLVKRTTPFPVECIVRGYLEGSGWNDYQKTGGVCGHALPSGLQQCAKLPTPIFTPATKAESGHDENIDEAEFIAILGEETAQELKRISLKVYDVATKFAESRGIIIADTKFEFGTDSFGNILLIDEVLTPDSSRFWSTENYSPGKPQASFDKQFVREYLETLDWDKTPPAPELPQEIVDATTSRYLEAYKLLTGRDL